MGGPKTTIDCNQSSQDFFTIEGLEIPAGQEENPACVEKTPTTTPEVQPPPCEDNFLDQLQTGFTTPASNGTNAPATVPNNPDINAANLLLENLYKDVSEWEGPTAELIIAHLRNTEYTIQISPKTALTTLRNIEKLVAIAQNFESLPEEIKNSKLGQDVLFEIESLIGLVSEGIDNDEIAAVSAHVNTLKHFQNYEENVRLPAQKHLNGYYPGYLPPDAIDFEYHYKNQYRNALDYEMLDNLPICRALASLSHQDQLELFEILSALRSSGYNEGNLSENPLLSETDIDSLDKWIEAREVILRGDALKRLFKKADSLSAETAQMDSFKESARLRLEVEEEKRFINELQLVRKNFTNVDKDGRDALRQLLLKRLQEIRKKEEERAIGHSNNPIPTEAELNQIFSLDRNKAGLENLFNINLDGLPGPYLLWLNQTIANLESGRPLTESDLILAEKIIAGDLQGDIEELSRKSGVSQDVAGALNNLNVPFEGALDEEAFIKNVDRALTEIDSAVLTRSILETRDSIRSLLENNQNLIGVSDYEEREIRKDLENLAKEYDRAIALLANGNYEGAKNLYLQLIESYHQKAVFKLFGEYQEESAQNKFLIKMGIIVASAALAGITTTAILSDAAASLSATQMAALRLLTESGAFVGYEKFLNYKILDEKPYDPSRGFWGNAADYGVQYLETVGMFGITRWAHIKYEKNIGGWLFKRAEERLIKAGKLTKGLAQTSEAARAMVVAEMRAGFSGLLWDSLYRLGALGTEYKAFKGYEFLQAVVEDSLGIKEGNPMDVFSNASMGETLKTLICLKIGGVLLSPITVPMTEETARVMLARHKPQLDALESETRAAHQELADYVKKGERDPSRLEAIRRRLTDSLTKRQRLIQNLVRAGLSTPEILAQTDAALAEASRAPRDAKALDELLKRVDAKDDSTWEYLPSDEAFVNDTLTTLTEDSPERLSQENGTYLLELSGGKKLIIRPKEAAEQPNVQQAGTSAPNDYTRLVNADEVSPRDMTTPGKPNGVSKSIDERVSAANVITLPTGRNLLEGQESAVTMSIPEGVNYSFNLPFGLEKTSSIYFDIKNPRDAAYLAATPSNFESKVTNNFDIVIIKHPPEASADVAELIHPQTGRLVASFQTKDGSTFSVIYQQGLDFAVVQKIAESYLANKSEITANEGQNYDDAHTKRASGSVLLDPSPARDVLVTNGDGSIVITIPAGEKTSDFLTRDATGQTVISYDGKMIPLKEAVIVEGNGDVEYGFGEKEVGHKTAYPEKPPSARPSLSSEPPLSGRNNPLPPDSPIIEKAATETPVESPPVIVTKNEADLKTSCSGARDILEFLQVLRSYEGPDIVIEGSSISPKQAAKILNDLLLYNSAEIKDLPNLGWIEDIAYKLLSKIKNTMAKDIMPALDRRAYTFYTKGRTFQLFFDELKTSFEEFLKLRIKYVPEGVPTFEALRMLQQAAIDIRNLPKNDGGLALIAYLKASPLRFEETGMVKSVERGVGVEDLGIRDAVNEIIKARSEKIVSTLIGVLKGRPFARYKIGLDHFEDNYKIAEEAKKLQDKILSAKSIDEIIDLLEKSPFSSIEDIAFATLEETLRNYKNGDAVIKDIPELLGIRRRIKELDEESKTSAPLFKVDRTLSPENQLKLIDEYTANGGPLYKYVESLFKNGQPGKFKKFLDIITGNDGGGIERRYTKEELWTTVKDVLAGRKAFLEWIPRDGNLRKCVERIMQAKVDAVKEMMAKNGETWPSEFSPYDGRSLNGKLKDQYIFAVQHLRVKAGLPIEPFVSEAAKQVAIDAVKKWTGKNPADFEAARKVIIYDFFSEEGLKNNRFWKEAGKEEREAVIESLFGNKMSIELPEKAAYLALQRIGEGGFYREVRGDYVETDHGLVAKLSLGDLHKAYAVGGGEKFCFGHTHPYRREKKVYSDHVDRSATIYMDSVTKHDYDDGVYKIFPSGNYDHEKGEWDGDFFVVAKHAAKYTASGNAIKEPPNRFWHDGYFWHRIYQHNGGSLMRYTPARNGQPAKMEIFWAVKPGMKADGREDIPRIIKDLQACAKHEGIELEVKEISYKELEDKGRFEPKYKPEEFPASSQNLGPRAVEKHRLSIAITWLVNQITGKELTFKGLESADIAFLEMVETDLDRIYKMKKNGEPVSILPNILDFLNSRLDGDVIMTNGVAIPVK